MKLRTALIVGVVTLLIWLWAELAVHAQRGRSGADELRLTNLPVWVSAPADATGPGAQVVARVEPAPETSVVVRGHAATLDALRDGTLKAHLVVELTSEDLALGPGTVIVKEAGVGPTSAELVIEGPRPTVRVRLEARSAR
jgi:hypothetical protein